MNLLVIDRSVSPGYQHTRVHTMEKPNCILEYNGQMGGVDKCDQVIKPYDATRKSLIWYKKLCIHLLQLAMLNAHIVYKSSNKEPRLSFMDFTKEVIHSLLFQHDGEASHASQPEDLLRVTGRHFPQKVAPTGAKALVQKRCKVCCHKGVRHESRYTCDLCPSHNRDSVWSQVSKRIIQRTSTGSKLSSLMSICYRSITFTSY